MKENKICIIQARCTVEEDKEISKAAKKKGMKRSDYIREMVCHNGKDKSPNCKNVQLAIEVQEVLNYLEENCLVKDKTLERKVDRIWKML